MEAHNGLSARIVREAGFSGIWASGLSISAQLGVRDNNEASWTQVVDVLEFMADASDLPILLDGDTGYGNFNNMRRLVRKLEQRGIAGVCIEDKQFPKTNSFLNGERQPLADIAEFAGKIAAGKDTQSDPNFSIVARVEALIAGWGMDEALRRAEAYRLAGADAILIHSKLSKPDEILTFAREWAGRGPLVIVPTKYYSTPTNVFRLAGISLVIWANHMVRSATSAMQSVAKEVFTSQTLVNIEDRIVSVDEIFRLQDADEYSAAERLYLSASTTSRSAVVLAASRGKGPRGGHHRPSEGHVADRRQAAAALARRQLQEGEHQRHHGRRRLPGRCDRPGGYPAGRERAIRADRTSSPRSPVPSTRSSRTRSSPTATCCSAATCCATWSSARPISRWWSTPRRRMPATAPCGISLTAIGGDDRGLFGTQVLLKRVVSRADARPAGTAEEEPQGRWIGMLNVSRQGLVKLKAVLQTLRAAAGLRFARHARVVECADRGWCRDRSPLRARPLAGCERSRRFPSRGRFRACADAVRQCAGRGTR